VGSWLVQEERALLRMKPVPVLLAAVVALACCAAGRAQEEAVDIGRLLRDYNAGIERAVSRIDSLSVRQLMYEPQEDGSNKRAEALLRYSRATGMTREVEHSEISHLVGKYTLQSLVGPVIDTMEYRVEYAGEEEQEGHLCYRLDLTALRRDADHFDGTVWVSVEEPGPVRIVGKVADPPFPAVEVLLDKAFEPGPEGIWLVRRHTGEAQVRLLVTRRGTRHIFYEDYAVKLDAGP
jgi:hypothetical protein